MKSGLYKLVATVAVAVLMTFGVSANAFAAGPANSAHKKSAMHTYIIERNIPGAGSFSKAKLREISQKSNAVLKDMGKDNIQWVDSYVTGDKVYCIYRAKNEDLIREHAKRGGFPADRISEIDTMISPATGK